MYAIGLKQMFRLVVKFLSFVMVAYEMRAELVQPPRMLIICIRD